MKISPPLYQKVPNFWREFFWSVNFFVKYCFNLLQTSWSCWMGHYLQPKPQKHIFYPFRGLGRAILGKKILKSSKLFKNGSPHAPEWVEYMFLRFKLQVVTHSTTSGRLKWIEAVFHKKIPDQKNSLQKLGTFWYKGGEIFMMN